MTTTATLLWLVLFSTLFAILGIVLSRGQRWSLENYTTARNSQTTLSTSLTLLASSLGAWILFSPAQAATWGGVGAIAGYGFGSMTSCLVMMALGRRMRCIIPQGHTLTEFVQTRYGRTVHILTLLVMLLYMTIGLIAEITAMGKIIHLIAPVPLWVTAVIVMLATLVYTTYGGLRATILTDKLQMTIIVPMLAFLCVLGWQMAGGLDTTWTTLQAQAPELLDWTNATGWRSGLTLFIAVITPALFHQGNWQRVYVARTDRSMRHGFLASGLLSLPIIVAMGLFGLVFVAQGGTGDASVALFEVVWPHMPAWAVVGLIPLGMSLVMSTADTGLNAISSLVTVDVHRTFPGLSHAGLVKLSRWLIVILAVPIVIISARGYSVLYLFLLADLVCTAAAFPIFLGMFTRYHDGRSASVGIIAGLLAGGWFFPAPGGSTDTLLEAFLVALLAPMLVTWLMRGLGLCRHAFDPQRYAAEITTLD